MTSLQRFLFFSGWIIAVPFILYGLLLIFLRIVDWWQRHHVRYGRCRHCGCTDDNCSECALATGEPCWWVDSSHTLCSRCVDDLAPADVEDLVSPDCSPLNAAASNRGLRGSDGWRKA